MPAFDIEYIIITVAFMLGLGLILSSVLAFANKKLWVFEDPRIDEVEEMLPSTNCGACGTAGCRPFAEALIAGQIEPASCTVNSNEATDEIADYLGVDSGDVIKRVARLACAGGSNVAKNKGHYAGMETCRAAAIIAGGPKSCSWGCIGLEDCLRACDQNAITMNTHGLPIVDPEKCTACDDCVVICPKDLFSLEPVNQQLWVACKNLIHGDGAESDCEVACNSCERCVVDSPDGLIIMKDNLAVIDYQKNHLASPVATERCPTGAIVWLNNEIALKGTKAKQIVRNQALPIH
ncbi:MAG: RnfABCDGE type electron transport complex subunit B [Gammaproteobacteria bacterium]|mgnify:FL=1|jgi:RnfABCDGE-type electron transport complex B subunit|nr:RnfABCDGE type electron transport complex subunit B [Gammaproteobacteria bacterium]MBT3724211.1 RnfABCDGE type electron transport complex subunit B [Gammaproteobacteria bacterium]MBT4075648.1 RnfABCDGE type electron transport complex subunit B [Gammaproteobacteria bacterium]MBT4193116.1 RnfABCDGE type electron transport complex subunit B [Gammaproteobacteria bacterium]MBT4450251.1 RnfABCDGE type electron transport complex subunit B [Gammaproteobacteria bacterium]